MKRMKLKRLMAGLWTAAFVVMSGMTALAADTVDVKGSGSYASDTDVVVGYQDKDLFSNMKDLMPGDTLTNTVAMANQSSREITLYMKAFSEFTSEDGKTAVRDKSTASADGKTFRDDILNQIDMTLTLGSKVIYKGSADGNTPDSGYQALTAGDYGISLGAFAAGQKETLTIELHLPGPEFDNSFVNSFDAVDWVFYAEGTTPSSNNGGGSHGGGGGGGSSVTRITDSEVPLGPWTGDGDSNILITDPDVPLASLPKLGDTGITGYVFGIMLALLIACSALYMRKRYSRS